MPLRVASEEWKPKDVPGLEPTADHVVRGMHNTLVIAGPGAGKTELLATKRFDMPWILLSGSTTPCSGSRDIRVVPM